MYKKGYSLTWHMYKQKIQNQDVAHERQAPKPLEHQEFAGDWMKFTSFNLK